MVTYKFYPKLGGLRTTSRKYRNFVSFSGDSHGKFILESNISYSYSLTQITGLNTNTNTNTANCCSRIDASSHLVCSIASNCFESREAIIFSWSSCGTNYEWSQRSDQTCGDRLNYDRWRSQLLTASQVLSFLKLALRGGGGL